MHQYRDRPMDFADATLIRIAERESISLILTIDHDDFETYRIQGRRRFPINFTNPLRGLLITCSCSRHISEAVFAEMQAEAAKDAWCWVRVLEATDHPILLPVPETLHQKCFILVIRY